MSKDQQMARRKATAGEKWANRVCKSTKAIDWATAVVAYDEAMKLVKRREQSAATHAMMAEREVWSVVLKDATIRSDEKVRLLLARLSQAPTKGAVRK